MPLCDLVPGDSSEVRPGQNGVLLTGRLVSKTPRFTERWAKGCVVAVIRWSWRSVMVVGVLFLRQSRYLDIRIAASIDQVRNPQLEQIGALRKPISQINWMEARFLIAHISIARFHEHRYVEWRPLDIDVLSRAGKYMYSVR